jgi:hypothetical protein
VVAAELDAAALDDAVANVGAVHVCFAWGRCSVPRGLALGGGLEVLDCGHLRRFG